MFDEQQLATAMPRNLATLSDFAVSETYQKLHVLIDTITTTND